MPFDTILEDSRLLHNYNETNVIRSIMLNRCLTIIMMD